MKQKKKRDTVVLPPLIDPKNGIASFRASRRVNFVPARRAEPSSILGGMMTNNNTSFGGQNGRRRVGRTIVLNGLSENRDGNMFANKLQSFVRGGIAQSRYIQNNTAAMLMPTSQRNFGANEKVLAMRIKAVGNIGKITKAMKMVAAAKMRGDLVRLQNGRNFGINGIDMMFKADPAMMRKAGEMPADPKELLLPLSSDRGLCGGINSGIFRYLRGYLANKDHSKVRIFSIGDKGAAAMKRPFPDMLTMGISDIQSPYNYPMCMSVGEHVVKNSADVDRIKLYYNEFKSAIAYEIREVELMPKHRFSDIAKSGNLYFKMAIPDKNLAVPALYELYISSNLWVAFLNNSAAEQSSRMTAMENASKNAGEIVQALKLKYNYARQARITTELCEIISGASAME